MTQVAKAVSIALNKCVNCLPGLSDVDYASKHVMQESDRFNDVPVSVRYYELCNIIHFKVFIFIKCTYYILLYIIVYYFVLLCSMT